jgi:hypothetical protein
LVTPEYGGDLEYAPLWCGESCTLVDEIRPAAVLQIVNDPVRFPRRQQRAGLAGVATGAIKTDASSGDLKNAVEGVLANFPPR